MSAALDPWQWSDDEADARWTTADPADLVESLGDLLELLERPAWHASAACRGQGTEAFFPARGERTEASTFCSACPVADQCLDAGLDEHHGTWGGTSERQRRQIRKERRLIRSRAAPAV